MNVTVIIPTYQRQNSLLIAIRSVVEQTRRPDEIIVVVSDPLEYDDVKSRIAAEFPEENIKSVTADVKLTGGAARNLGAKFSNGRFIFFLDDDDEFRPGKIERHLAAHLSLETEVVYSEAILRYNDGTSRRAKLMLNGVIPFSQKLAYSGICPSSTSCVSVERSAFEAVQGFDPSLESYQDLDLWYRMSSAGFRFLALQHPLTVFVQHCQPRVSTSYQKRIRAGDALLNKHPGCDGLKLLIVGDRASIDGRVSLTNAHAGQWRAILFIFSSVLRGRTPLFSRETAANICRIFVALLSNAGPRRTGAGRTLCN
jgi:glycosyltransferase involved in cell wall biosynthesis